MQEYKYSIPRTRSRTDDYELVYLESKEYVLVYKNKKVHYFIKVGKDKKLSCNCPWSVRTGGIPGMKSCQHIQHALDNLNFDKRKEVRDFIKKINEEIAVGELARHLATFNR